MSFPLSIPLACCISPEELFKGDSYVNYCFLELLLSAANTPTAIYSPLWD
jgi:hypothetical protein